MSVNTLEVSQQSSPDIPASATSDSTLTEVDNDYIGAADRMLDNEQPLDDQHDDKTDGTETNQENRFGDLPEPSVDIDEKHPSDDELLSYNDNYIGAADRMLDNEQPLQDPLNEAGSDIDSPPAPESFIENNGETESKKDTYHDAGDIQQSAVTETSSPNNNELDDAEQMLNQEQPLGNNDSTIEPGSPQKSTETVDKTNNDPAAEETRERPSPVVEDEPWSSLESADTIGQDSETQHFADQQPNRPFPDQQLTENKATKTAQTDEDLPPTEIGQLDEKIFGTQETAPVDTDWEGNELSVAAREGTANLHPYSGNLPEKSDVMDVGIQGLLSQRIHGLDLKPSEEHDTGISRPDRGLPDAPPGYEIAPQIKPALQQPIDPTHTRKSPAGDTPSTSNDNPENGHGIPDENPLPDNPSHNADGDAALQQLRAASSTETNNESNDDDHVIQSVTGAAENVTNHASDEIKDSANDAEGNGDENEGADETIREAYKKVPNEWGDGQPNRRGIGHRWVDPNNPKGNGVRIDQGNPNSSLPNQRVDHVIVRKDGEVIGRDGKPIEGSKKSDAENSHIPLEEWLRWSQWDTP